MEEERGRGMTYKQEMRPDKERRGRCPKTGGKGLFPDTPQQSAAQGL